MRGVSLLVLTILFLFPNTAEAADARLVSIQTPRGVIQKFILLNPAKPVAAVILFAGGHGGLGLMNKNSMSWGRGNFLVRTRFDFAAQGLMVAVIDAPSDRNRMNAIFRMSRAHSADITAVAAYLKAQANVPVWLVGTSMGSFSAAGGAIKARGIDGLVLTSSVTRSARRWKIASSHPDGVASMDLGRIRVPVLVMSHRNDQCRYTPATDAPKLTRRLTGSRKVETVLLDGGAPPVSRPCQARAEHGFYGIETKAVSKIVEFIKANGP